MSTSGFAVGSPLAGRTTGSDICSARRSSASRTASSITEFTDRVPASSDLRDARQQIVVDRDRHAHVSSASAI